MHDFKNVLVYTLLYTFFNVKLYLCTYNLKKKMKIRNEILTF